MGVNVAVGHVRLAGPLMTSQKSLIGFVYNGQIPWASDLVSSLIDSLGLADRAWSSAADSVTERESELSCTETVVTAGGDGTILRTVRVTAPRDLPILSINLGKVGFMSELEVDFAEAGNPSDHLFPERPQKLRRVERLVIETGRHEPPEHAQQRGLVTSQAAKVILAARRHSVRN